MAINWFNGDPPVPAVTSTQSRFHAIVEALEAQCEASWPSLSTVERQHALTALAQAKQFAEKHLRTGLETFLELF
ncbi:MAG TPA: hypothetical protein VKE72_06365 [Methylocella sp.]|nr:hypothetical protein [Methylocella sp.]